MVHFSNQICDRRMRLDYLCKTLQSMYLGFNHSGYLCLMGNEHVEASKKLFENIVLANGNVKGHRYRGLQFCTAKVTENDQFISRQTIG